MKTSYLFLVFCVFSSSPLSIQTGFAADDSTRSSISVANEWEDLKESFEESDMDIFETDILWTIRGRCFSQSSSKAMGMILITSGNREVVVREESGPRFPRITKTERRMVMVENVASPTTDEMTSEEYRDYWRDPAITGFVLVQNNPKSLTSDGIIHSRFKDEKVHYEIKRNSDGNFYGHVYGNNEKKFSEYCYFWKKLF